MAINIPILTEFSDAGLKSAQGAFNNFKAKVGEAEGAMGKFKAGGTAALDAVKANAGMFAAAAGAAIAGFAVKAVSAFQDLALEVDHFSDVTGIAAEQASKWIEVAGDLGVESGVVEGAINRMNRELGKGTEKFEELGIEIVKTDDGATDVNATFLNTIDALKNIKDPAERATAAAEILGKGWTGMAELVEMGAIELKDALDSVAGAKVIDEKEIEKAKNLREAQDALGDAIEEVSLTVGQKLLPVFVELVEMAVPLLDKLGTAVGFVAEGIQEGTENSDNWFESIVELLNPWDAYQDALEDTDSTTEDLNANTNILSERLRNVTRKVMDAYHANQDLAEAAAELENEWQRLLDTISQEEAWDNVIEQFAEVQDKSFEAFVSGTAEDLQVAQKEANDLIRDIAKYVDELGTIPPDVQTKIIGLLERNAFDEALALLNNLRQGAVVPITGTVSGMPVPAGQTPSETTGRRPAAPAPIRIPRPGTVESRSIVVNVGGSVIAENDLVETVRKGLVNAQRNGSGLVYTNK